MTVPPPFSRIKIRTAGLVFCGDEIALIRRARPGSVVHSLPGGNAEPGEGLVDALRRELHEELALDVDRAEGGELLWVIDQMVSRPGATPPPRKLHMVYRFHVDESVRAALATQEHDELPDGTYDVGTVEWVDYREASGLALFPPVGRGLSGLPHARAGVPDAALEAITDRNYVWL
ncbi:NUDIX domain-containing protein [Streptomyces sp. SYP-A7185]|uniref:NUDIX domain-containing protein n=1 Tax=Streptomyces sp. SYP-A7185 TaxID=3040076 RepID=UPI0038F81E6C